MNQSPDAVLVREETPDDAAAIHAIHVAAFGRPDEARLVAALRRDGDFLISLVAEAATETGRRLVGHVLFHRLPVVDPSGRPLFEAASLAPLAVLPDRQRTGIGARLVREGLERLRSRGVPAAVVLGEPEYYGRFGFAHATAASLETPYACPEYQAVELVPGALSGVVGRVVYPRAFDAL